MPNAPRIGMTPADALQALDERIATAVARFGEGGYACYSIPEIRAISAAFHRMIDERPTHTPTEPII